MKNVVLIICVLFYFNFSVNAQTFSFERGDTTIQTRNLICYEDLPYMLDVFNALVNDNDHDLTIVVKTLSANFPSVWGSTCRYQGIIPLQGCFDQLDDTVILNKNSHMNFGWNTWITPGEYPTSSMEATILFYDINDPANSRDTFYFKRTLKNRFDDLGFVRFQPSISEKTIVYDPDGTNSFSHLVTGHYYIPRMQKNAYWERVVNEIPSNWVFDCNHFSNCNEESGVITLYCKTPYTKDFHLGINLHSIVTEPQRMVQKYKFYTPSDSVQTESYITYISTICPPIKRTPIIDYQGPSQICEGDSLQLGVLPGYNNLIWSNGSTDSILQLIVSDTISLEAKDTFGCPIRDTMIFNIGRPQQDSLCMVTNDPISGNNLLIWEKTLYPLTSHYVIYKEGSVFNQFDSIGMVPYSDPSFFEDRDSDPRVSSVHYKIASRDNCGNLSELSKGHKTLHLTANKGVSNEVNLIWSNYEGLDYQSINILRSVNKEPFVMIAQRAKNNFTFTDLTPPSGPNLTYQIEISLDDPCSPRRNPEFSSIRSNKIVFDPVGINENLNISNLQFLPNPVEDFMLFENKSMQSFQIEIIDVNGKVCKNFDVPTGVIEIMCEEIRPGMYFLRIQNGTWRYIEKMFKY